MFNLARLIGMREKKCYFVHGMGERAFPVEAQMHRGEEKGRRVGVLWRWRRRKAQGPLVSLVDRLVTRERVATPATSATQSRATLLPLVRQSRLPPPLSRLPIIKKTIANHAPPRASSTQRLARAEVIKKCRDQTQLGITRSERTHDCLFYKKNSGIDNKVPQGKECPEEGRTLEKPTARESTLTKHDKMTTETLSREVDAHIVTLLTRLSNLKENNAELTERRVPMSVEARSLELWRAVAVECFATFLFSLIVSGAAAASAVSGSGLSVLATAVASGFAISAIYLIFGHISGGHVNPGVSVSFALCRRISPLRAALYIAAQCGGGIAGAAMLYGVTTPTNTQTLTSPGRLGGAIERLLVELTLSVFVVLAHFASDTPRSLPTSISSKPAGVLAAAYTAATLVSSPFLNPARALGPAFVSNRWDNHWVYWVGPVSGGAVAALLHEYVLSPKRSRDSRDMDDGDNSSMRSDEDTYDDLDKPSGPKFPGAYATYRPVAGASSSIYSAPPTALERVESIYGGTKSLYCKSPPLTRANLNRSQSVYAKSTSGPRDGLMIPKPGPLVPAQSLYPIRIGQNGAQNPARDTQPAGVTPQAQSSQNHNTTNQNMQNQLQQCTQSIYGIRGISTSLSTRENGIYGVSTGSSIYGRAPAPPPSTQNPQQPGQNVQAAVPGHQPQPPPQQHQTTVLSATAENAANARRPESMYGHVSRRSDDSAYGSYQGSTRGNYGKVPGPPGPPSGPPGPPQYRDQGRPSPAGPLQQNQTQQSNFQRNSPNPQY